MIRSGMNLRHAELKAGRALEHLEDLKRELQAYYASEPCVFTKYEKPDVGRRFLRIDVKDLDDKAYLCLGDFAHNLRSVLDHIVYSLVIKGTGTVPDSKKVQWPVLKNDNKKKNDINHNINNIVLIIAQIAIKFYIYFGKTISVSLFVKICFFLLCQSSDELLSMWTHDKLKLALLDGLTMNN